MSMMAGHLVLLRKVSDKGLRDFEPIIFKQMNEDERHPHTSLGSSFENENRVLRPMVWTETVR
jgi:hypothetical protein